MGRLIILAVTLGVALAPGVTPVWATNGMNLEGYGPVSVGMGGASMAFDNGTAAVMGNPATLGLGRGGRLDLAVGRLGPDVGASLATPAGAVDATSKATAFYMPAAGWTTRRGRLTLGLGAFAQGGMGTEFGRSSWLADPSAGANTALQEGLVNRSEVSVGRLLLPLAYEVSPRLHVGGTVDLVWAGLDLKMAMSEAQFVDLATTHGGGQVGGSLAGAFGALYEPFGGTGIRRLYHAYFDFSNGSPFTGQARGLGTAAKLGVVYQVAAGLQIGAAWHSQTRLGNLKSDTAAMRMAVDVDTGLLQAGQPNGEYADVDIPVSGRITIDDFQWPAGFGAGVSWQPSPTLQLVADVRRVNWSAVMEDFTMVFVADATPENGAFAGQRLEATLYQAWKDQTILALGSAWQPSERLTLRAGFNQAGNPVPDRYLNALFPAIVETHLTFGGGWALGPRDAFELGVTRGFEKEATNPGNGTTVPAVTSSHGQWNLQAMYTHRL